MVGDGPCEGVKRGDGCLALDELVIAAVRPGKGGYTTPGFFNLIQTPLSLSIPGECIPVMSVGIQNTPLITCVPGEAFEQASRDADCGG